MVIWLLDNFPGEEPQSAEFQKRCVLLLELLCQSHHLSLTRIFAKALSSRLTIAVFALAVTDYAWSTPAIAMSVLASSIDQRQKKEVVTLSLLDADGLSVAQSRYCGLGPVSRSGISQFHHVLVSPSHSSYPPYSFLLGCLHMYIFRFRLRSDCRALAQILIRDKCRAKYNSVQ